MLHSKYILLLITALLIASSAFPQTSGIKAEHGTFIHRTLSKLHFSSQKNPQDVDIVVAGQFYHSESWCSDLEEMLQKRFPFAGVTIHNFSDNSLNLGQLQKTNTYNILPDFPDLIIFSSKESPEQIKKHIRVLRHNTSSEFVFCNPESSFQYRESHETEDHYSLFCNQYRIELLSLPVQPTDPQNLLKTGQNSIQAKPSSSQTTKLSPLYVSLFNLFMNFPAAVSPYPYLTDTLNLNIQPDVTRLDFDFTGTAVEFIADSCDNNYRILINGLPPSEYQSGFFKTKPVHHHPDNPPISELCRLLSINSLSSLQKENWVLEFSKNKEAELGYSVYGNVTGFDGSGKINEPFISNSGRIIIEPDDWKIPKNRLPLFPEKITWNVYNQSHDFIEVKHSESKIWVVQGLPCESHLLQVISYNDAPLPDFKLIIHKNFDSVIPVK